jgi:hypothetical protein
MPHQEEHADSVEQLQPPSEMSSVARQPGMPPRDESSAPAGLFEPGPPFDTAAYEDELKQYTDAVVAERAQGAALIACLP